MTPSDIVAGGRYLGGNAGRIRVVTKLHGDSYWVWWHWNSTTTSNLSSMPAFLKWAKERV
jgi:hypothetical protein